MVVEEVHGVVMWRCSKSIRLKEMRKEKKEGERERENETMECNSTKREWKIGFEPLSRATPV